LKGKAKIAKLNITDAESLESDLQFSRFPVIRFYPVGTKKLDTYFQFSGVQKKFSILEWANIQLSIKEASIDIPELNKENYKTMCKDSKSTCIIAFVEDPSSVSGQIG
jgi:hypothetical protein